MNTTKKGFRSQQLTPKAHVLCLFWYFYTGEGFSYCIKISRNIDPTTGYGIFIKNMLDEAERRDRSI